jgi:hypothetical protein
MAGLVTDFEVLETIKANISTRPPPGMKIVDGALVPGEPVNDGTSQTHVRPYRTDSPLA